jgi:signal transduction histidine kinase
MKFPKVVKDCLLTEFVRSRRPFCFLVDADHRLREWWGEAAKHGFGNLSAGEDMLERAPYLLGHLGHGPEYLPFISVAESASVDVHILPADEGHYVIITDSGREHDFRQQRQQTANEVRLLHAAQQKLIERQRALISELVEARTELDHRRREAERANADKSRFIAMMSHEFRTPLASIINYADLAMAKDTGVATVRKSAEAIARASRHMNRLVETVLDEARLEAGQVKLEERAFELRALLDDIAAIMAPLAAEKALSFGIYGTPDTPDSVIADDGCLRQILVNLLGNAVKFTETGGVRLDVCWEDDLLRAVVSDTGPGIAVEDQRRIFRAFERGADAGRSEGTGLGLTIALRLAELMRGDVDLDSSSGAGCRVTVTVPAPASAADVDEEDALPEPDADFRARRPATILLCDDDEDLLALAEYYLVRAGYGLLIARNGEEAVEKALAYRPDLVLMDINTPRLSGSAAAARLREQGFTGPVVALTASDVRKLDDRHFTSSLRKPIRMPRLLAQIQAYV